MWGGKRGEGAGSERARERERGTGRREWREGETVGESAPRRGRPPETIAGLSDLLGGARNGWLAVVGTELLKKLYKRTAHKQLPPSLPLTFFISLSDH